MEKSMSDNIMDRISQHEQADYFGMLNRIDQTVEEMAELTQALCKYKRLVSHDRTLSNQDANMIKYGMIEELADVENCIEQLKYLLCGVDTKQIEQIKSDKINRTKRKILNNETNNKT